MLPLLFLPNDKFVGERPDLVEVALDGRERIVKQIATQVLHGTLHKNGIVGGIAPHAGLLPADKTQFGVGIPVAMGDPASEEADLPVKAAPVEPLGIAVSEEFPDGGEEFFGEFLIAVQQEYPGLCAVVEGDLLLCRVTEPGLVDDPGSRSLS